MSWQAVRQWRDLLSARVPTGTGLSEAGLRLAWSNALDVLDDASLSSVAAIPGQPFESAVVVLAGTVPTAAIEWCAVLLGRGTSVTLKHPTGAPGLTPLLVEVAEAVDLPLTSTDDRSVVGTAPLVVAMGSDDTIRHVRTAIRPDARLLAHGHRFSAAWLCDASSWPALAHDAALHDGRGCLSPVVVFTPLPLEQAVEGLGASLDEVARTIPLGVVDDSEGAAIRRRRALACVTGAVAEGPAWSVHGLPAAHWRPVALPRSIAVVSVSGREQAAAILAARRHQLSTIGTDDPSSVAQWHRAGASRVCRLGEMQKPPLRRAHDGEDWVAATLRATSSDGF